MYPDEKSPESHIKRLYGSLRIKRLLSTVLFYSIVRFPGSLPGLYQSPFSSAEGEQYFFIALAALGENVPFATLCDSYCLMPTERAYFCFNHS